MNSIDRETKAVTADAAALRRRLAHAIEKLDAIGEEKAPGPETEG